jgi:glycosyltransferase involved in cell wall biosynthesis
MVAISVIVPTYDAARYLRESLDSILTQTGPDDEVVVVDDGSTDDTPAVLASYGERIRVVGAAHGGYAAARNLGLERARGEWVSFHDADDVALPDRLDFQRGLAAWHRDCEAFFCNGQRMDTGSPLVPAALARRASRRLLTTADVFHGFPIYFQAALVRRATFAAVGPFDPTLRVHADMEYGYRLLARAAARFVDRSVFRYRWHDTNTTGDRLRGREEIARVLDAWRRGDPDGVRAVGERRVRARLARHYYRLARWRLRLDDARQARAALGRALALRPLDPRLHLMRLWYARILQVREAG